MSLLSVASIFHQNPPQNSELGLAELAELEHWLCGQSQQPESSRREKRTAERDLRFGFETV